ncbi:MAG: Gfo/Idh/MocA family protein [bacterium]
MKPNNENQHLRESIMNVSVIGCGYWGPNLIRNFYSAPDCHVSICADLDVKKLERMRRLFPGIQVTTDYKDILRDPAIDAVAIATPVYLHYSLAKECLEAGKHIFVEKPLAASTEECIDLISLAEENGKILMVGHTFEYNPAVNKAKEILESGEIGDVLYIRCARLNLGLFQPDINVIWDLAPHDISILLYLLGKNPISVNGQGQSHYFEKIEDVATATLNFDNGQIAFLYASWLDPYKVRKMTIVGTKKMLVYDDTHPNEKIKIFDKGIEAPAQYDNFGEFQFSYRYGDIFSPRIEEREPVKIECEHFLGCIRENKAPRSDGYSGMRVVAILEAICESMKRKGALISMENGFAFEPTQPSDDSANGKNGDLVYKQKRLLA